MHTHNIYQFSKLKILRLSFKVVWTITTTGILWNMLNKLEQKLTFHHPLHKHRRYLLVQTHPHNSEPVLEKEMVVRKDISWSKSGGKLRLLLQVIKPQEFQKFLSLFVYIITHYIRIIEKEEDTHVNTSKFWVLLHLLTILILSYAAHITCCTRYLKHPLQKSKDNFSSKKIITIKQGYKWSDYSRVTKKNSSLSTWATRMEFWVAPATMKSKE